MYQEVIDFWFKEIDQSSWWKKDDHFDELISARFSELHAKADHCELFSWRSSSLGMLAEVVVLDQFSRNMYRGLPASFGSDSLALALAQTAVAGGHDQALSTDMKKFLYMPYMHSESLLIHEQAVALFTALGDESTLQFEIRHKEIIERFGRYPHRNEILGRDSTPAELEFLDQPGSHF